MLLSFLCPISAPRLFVPDMPAKGLLKGQAYIAMGFGYASGPEIFDLAPTEGFMDVMIPHLAAYPGGIPQYSLFLGEFVEGNLPGFTSLEEITVGKDFIRVKNHGEKFEAFFDVSSPCVTPPTQVRHELEDEILKSLVLGDNVLLKLGECEGGHEEDIHDHCAKMEAIHDDVVAAGPNVCIATVVHSEETCDVAIELTTITKEFREMLVPGDEDLIVAGAEKFKGDFSSGLIYPCIE